MTIAPPSFPPMMQGLLAGAEPPFAAAQRAAAQGCDAGLILYDPGPEALEAAIVFAPEVPLGQALAMLPLCGVALQNALGALGPSELAVDLGWSGAVLLNGARAGVLRAAAPSRDPAVAPGWLVIGLSLRIAPFGDGGETPDETALHAEGAGDLAPEALLESWARHLANWVHRWEEDGIAPLHRDYAALVEGIGETVTLGGQSGTFLGLDEDLGMILRTGTGTRIVPLTALLEAPR